MGLKTENLYFTYLNQGSPVLNDISVSFEGNKIYLLLGPSGGGKSSLVNILAGIIPNNIKGEIKGNLCFDGKSIIEEEPYERANKIGFIMQDADTQFCTYKVEDELVFGLENLKFSREEMDKRIDYVLEILDIEHLRCRALNTLSGGQKQKVAIASVLVLDPPIIILDEPTANLDPISSKEIFQLIKMLKESYNKTIIIIEHKLDYLIDHVDYIFVFSSNGYIVNEGSPKKIFEDLIYSESSPSFHYPKIIDIWKNLKLPYYAISFDINEAGKYLGKRYNYKENSTEVIGQVNQNKFLSVSNISYKINDKEIINNLTFHINKGDFLAIAGPNGAGKSTLGGILLNLYKGYKGEVLIDNKSVKSYKRSDLWKKAGLVFQNPEWQFVSYSVREELEYSLKDSNLSDEEKEEKIDQCLERFKLLEFKNSNPYLLSQGQKRRLSVATMLVTGQDLLILDEPTYGQDHDNQVELLEYMSDLNSNGMTIIMITHDMDAVVKYCNKVLILKDGKSIYFGDNKDLFKDNSILKEANLLKPIYYEVLDKMDCNNSNIPTNIEDFVESLKEKELDYD